MVGDDKSHALYTTHSVDAAVASPVILAEVARLAAVTNGDRALIANLSTPWDLRVKDPSGRLVFEQTVLPVWEAALLKRVTFALHFGGVFLDAVAHCANSHGRT